jgi:hemerythrin-like domain-containing protein
MGGDANDGCADQERTMSHAVDVLRHEHDAILMALRILDRIADEAKDGKIEKADVANFLGFLKEFADKCHHGKEEWLLFPAMIDAGLPAQGGPLSEMLGEHEQGRALVAAMSQASDPELKGDAFAKAATAYSAHLRMHIEKENTVLFPLAERIVDPAILNSLSNEFETHEENVIGHGRHEQLHDILKAMKTKYLL